MAKSIRSKGARGELEVAKMFNADLNLNVKRNLMQTGSGGYDLVGIPLFALEVKRHETLSIGTWWKQALKQGKDTGRMPILMYRRSREQWWCVAEIGTVRGILEPTEIMLVPTRLFGETLVKFTWLSFLKLYRHYVGTTFVSTDEIDSL